MAQPDEFSSFRSICQLHYRLKMSPLLLLLFLLATFFYCPSAASSPSAYSQPVRPYSYHLTGGIASPNQDHSLTAAADNSHYHFSQQPLSPANRFNKFRSSAELASDSYVPESDDESSLYSGPQFLVEPEQADYRQPLAYSNLSSVSLTCKVSGYPTPRIDWRVDNISLSFLSTHPSSAHQHFNSEQADDDDHHQRQQTFSPQLNALVRLRNDGQTLLIGGQSEESGGRRNSTSSAYSPFYNHQSGHQHQHHFQPRQIECLASNQFGVTISRPVYVQQVPASSSTSGGSGGSSLNSFDASNFGGGHQFGSGPPYFGPHQPAAAAAPSPSVSVQLYDEFVSRGNVAVLKCLVISVATNLASEATLAKSPNVHQGPSSAEMSSAAASAAQLLYPSSAYHYHREHSSFASSSSSRFSFFPVGDNWWSEGSGSSSIASEFAFEWRIKNGPAASAATGETILTLRSNQTQGKYTAYPSGELHVRDVDEHDARRTYQCVIYPRAGARTGAGRPGQSSVSSPSSSSSSSSSLSRKYASSGSNAALPISTTSELHYGHQASHLQLPIESTFAQIILAGSEKDIFPPRLVHRLGGAGGGSSSAEIFAENGQLESILIPCAAQAQPLPSYRWFWLPMNAAAGVANFDLDAELAALHQTSSKSGGLGSLPHPLAISIPVQSGGGGSGAGLMVDQIMLGTYRRHQMSLSRLRTFGGGSTLAIPGPISQLDSGHYVALVQNSVGYERCSAALYVRSPLSIRLQWSTSAYSSVGAPSSTSSSTSTTSRSSSSSSSSSSSANRSRAVIRALRGEHIQLRCIVNGFPVSELSWLHNAQPVLGASSSNAAGTVISGGGSDSSGAGGSISGGGSLPRQTADNDVNGQSTSSSADSSISRLELHLDEQAKGGMYQCFARNRFQVVQSSVEVVVLDQSPSLVEKFSEMTVQPGDFVSLRCTSLASPLAQITWSVDGQAVANSARYRFGDFVVSSTGGSSTLLKSSSSPSNTLGVALQSASRLVSHFNITSVRVEDGGLYRCTAGNVAGAVAHQARLNVYGKAAVKAHTPNATALSNSDIELNCPFYGFPLKSIIWFGRDGSSRKLPINGRQHLSPNGTLHINKVNKKEDEGSYECEVQQESGLVARAKIFLKVITGPRIDNFTFASNLEEGMRSVAICAVIAGDPPIRIKWLKDGIQLGTNSEHPSHQTPLLQLSNYKIEMVNEFTSSITFTALRRRHAGRYTCIASNAASSDQHSADLKVNVAPNWLMEPRDIVAVSGQRLIIDCQAEGIPEPQIRWKMEAFESAGVLAADSNSINDRLTYSSGKKKSGSSAAASSSGSGSSSASGSTNSNTFHAVISNPHIQILENGSLFIKEVTRDDHRRYMCSAFNGVGSGISTIIRLAVNFPPQFIYGYYESKSIKVGESIVLTCLVKVEHIEPVAKNVSSSSSSSSSSSAFSGESNSLMMEMRWYKLDGKASPLSPPHSADQASASVVHDRYHITSTFELTDPASTMLFHNSTTSSSSSSSSTSSVNSEHTLYYVTKLTIRQVERADSGSYLCTAQNRYGFVRKNFSIVALEPPDRPPEVRTDSVTSSSLKISWLAPYDGNSPITEYVVAYRALAATVPVTVSVAVSAFGEVASSGSSFIVTKTPTGAKKSWITYQLTDLVPFTAYYIQIKAKNAIGYSQFSEAISVKTAEEPPSEIPTDVSILPLNTRSLKISWRRPRYSSVTKSLKSGSGAVGSVASKNGYIPPITGYYIGYRPSIDQMVDGGNSAKHINNEFVFKTVKAASSLSTSSSDHHSSSDSETFVLNNLKRATRYDIKIQAFNLAGAGPSTSELLGKTLDFDVPSAPRIRAIKSNLSSIELMWSVQGEEPIGGFVISYKPASANELSVSSASGSSAEVSERAMGNGHQDLGGQSTSTSSADEWKTIKLEVESVDEVVSSSLGGNGQTGDPKSLLYDASGVSSTVFHRRTYVLGGLRCGTKYFIYVNAYNQVGQGDPSEVILSRTEGNVPIAPESVQEFLSSNITFVRLNLNQWKKLGCPIELFEIDYRLYGGDHTSMAPHRVTYRPELSSAADHAKYLQAQGGGSNNNNYQVVKKDGGGKEPENETSLNPTASSISTTSASPTSLFNYEIFNLNPGSWYELIVRAQTEAGYVSREYYFSTLKVDGSTIAPLTLKATDGGGGGGHGSLGRGVDSSSFLSISSSKLAQLHYIVPVSCALFILFLVTVVVCAIHSNHQARQALQAGSGLHHSGSVHDQHGAGHGGHQPQHHFLLSFMTNRGCHRSDKVAGGNGKTICSNSSNASGHYTSSSGGTTTAGSCAGDGIGDGGGQQQQQQQQQLMMLLHDSTGNPLTDLSGTDFCTGKASLVFEDQGGRYGKPMLNGGGRSDSCHSLGGNQLTMVNMETLKMLKQQGSCENQQQPPPPPPLPPPTSSKSNPSFPLYNLPVPYATSAVQFAAAVSKAGGGDQCKSAESIYGTTTATATTTTAAAAAHYNKGQLSEMYCDSAQAAVGLVIIDTGNGGGQQMQQQCSPNDLHHLQQFQQLQQQQQQQQQQHQHQHQLQHHHRGSSGGSHQYELPFVFKCAPNPHNESTAF